MKRLKIENRKVKIMMNKNQSFGQWYIFKFYLPHGHEFLPLTAVFCYNFFDWGQFNKTKDIISNIAPCFWSQKTYKTYLFHITLFAVLIDLHKWQTQERSHEYLTKTEIF